MQVKSGPIRVEKNMRVDIKEFTGISAPYEQPLKPEIVLDADHQTIEEEVEAVIRYLKEKKII